MTLPAYERRPKAGILFAAQKPPKASGVATRQPVIFGGLPHSGLSGKG